MSLAPGPASDAPSQSSSQHAESGPWPRTWTQPRSATSPTSRTLIATVGDEGWDATDPDACNRLLDGASDVLGRIDRVVSTVGWTAITPFLDETPDYWRRIIDVNLHVEHLPGPRGRPGDA